MHGGWLGLALALVGCSNASSEPSAAPPTREPCPELELALPDGSCTRPGVPPERCAEGFAADGEYGCDALLPDAVCPSGSMAVPGDSACRPVAPCADGTWGAIPIDENTVHVDQSYAGGDSDGSASRPWTSIASAYSAAPASALIAIASGSYLEDVVAYKAVRFWGVCPEQVELVGTGAELAAVNVFSPVELHGVAIRGDADGVLVSGAQAVLLDGVWVHDTASRGVVVDSTFGATSVRMMGSLIERARDIGLYVAGSEATVEGSTVRETLPGAAQAFGRGINAQTRCTATECDAASRSSILVRGSLIEQNHEVGVYIGGSDATLEASVVRDTLPLASDQSLGIGIELHVPCLATGCFAAARARAVIKGSLIERSYETGLAVMGSEATVEDTVVRATEPRANDLTDGFGMLLQACIQTGCDAAARTTAVLRSSVVEQSHEAGILVTASDVDISATVVRDVLPRASDSSLGRGVAVQALCNFGECQAGTGANVAVRGSLVERNHQVGVSVLGSSLELGDSVVRSTFALDGRFGDAVAVFGGPLPVQLSLSNALLDQSARAGISNFGGATTLAGSAIRCAAFEIAGERFLNSDFSFTDGGGNRCGCPDLNRECVAVSPNLEPPDGAIP